MIKGKNIVVVGLQPWDIEIGSNCKNIASELSKHNKVLYVNMPLDTITKWRQKDKPMVKNRMAVINGERQDIERIQDNLWVFSPKILLDSINWLPKGALFDKMNKRNNRKLADEIKRVLPHLGFDSFILFNDSSMFKGLYLKEMLQPELSIYYLRDNLITQPYFKKHGETKEPELMSKYDIVLTNSVFLRDYAAKHNPYSYYVGSGCDFSLFQANFHRRKPADMRLITNPVIGYAGFLSAERLDISLLIYLATERPNYSFVMLGWEDEAFEQSALHGLDNVFFLGRKTPEEVPDYLAHFDVCINPQAINPLTIGNYPRKVDEYLAMGKPVVATYTSALDEFKDHCYLASSSDEFLSMVDVAILENNQALEKKRINFASGHTWEGNVKNISEAIVSYQQKKLAS